MNGMDAVGEGNLDLCDGHQRIVLFPTEDRDVWPAFLPFSLNRDALTNGNRSPRGYESAPLVARRILIRLKRSTEQMIQEAEDDEKYY